MAPMNWSHLELLQDFQILGYEMFSILSVHTIGIGFPLLKEKAYKHRLFLFCNF